MKAHFLGSAGLTILLRCICRRRLGLDRLRFLARGFARCDNCRSIIRYDLGVYSFAGERRRKLEEYESTGERRAVVEDLDAAQAALVRVASILAGEGNRFALKGEKVSAERRRERAHRLMNAAQSASAQRELLALDWAEEDRQKVA